VSNLRFSAETHTMASTATKALTIVSNCVVSGNGGAGLFNSVPFGPNNSVAGRGSMTISDSMISDNSGPGVQ
jgi:hypothetical protein